MKKRDPLILAAYRREVDTRAKKVLPKKGKGSKYKRHQKYKGVNYEH